MAKTHHNLNTAALYEQIILRNEAGLSEHGAVVALTGKYTGRSPNDKFVVREPSSEANVAWGKVNRPFDPQKFDVLHQRMLDYMKGKELFVQDCHAGADADHRLPIRVITEFAWQSLFARNMFIRPGTKEEIENHVPQFTVVCLPNFKADTEVDGTNSEAFILLNFGKKTILIGGTHYAGEIKKSIFTVLNYLLPLKNILSMHCSANVGSEGDAAIFFGLSGTGKTTLSADPERNLIGDDEHGWGDHGVFNFEGGCYAKVINLSEKAEPEIYACTRRFGTILENVIMDPATRRINLDMASLTENTRASYPLDYIPNAILDGKGGHPKNVVMLTCDAFGLLPPVARLSGAQAMYHFLSGYTARVAGTERGIKEPQATFSTCFGAPFMALKPSVYAKLLGEKIRRHGVNCWLVNTGWTGGPFGVGQRFAIADSRALLKAALSGAFLKLPMMTESRFGFEVPTQCPGISSQTILNPKKSWSSSKAYDEKAKHLAELFRDNFKEFEADVTKEIRNAGPVL
ncbi:MAG: phosphoenolpyruvate carboxykinase (ATP) [Deltaproteobacteria bacterium]|nr:phosphoenolpyruvate carboxykinase (ATP) [Deltaproteobacteria bacterium]